MKKITTRTGMSITVDDSNEAFLKMGFGSFKSGERVIDPFGKECILEGIGLDTSTRLKMVMWYTLKEDKGYSSYCLMPADYFTTI